MLRIKSERKRVEITEYSLEYFVDETGGYSFPCDENGNVLEMGPEALKNLEQCRQHPEKFIRPGHIRKDVHSYVEPAVGICSCGEDVILEDEYMGACQCGKCGQWYNLFGQELLPPGLWEENYYEDY